MQLQVVKCLINIKGKEILSVKTIDLLYRSLCRKKWYVPLLRLQQGHCSRKYRKAERALLFGKVIILVDL
jgi:hypothetical protein